MISIGNDTKIKDIPEPSLKLEIEGLIKSVMMDFGVVPTQESFSHLVGRMTYLISKKYKGLLLGEVKYILEETSEHLKGKLSVSTLLQLFSKYYDEKIERQRHEMEERDLTISSEYVNCMYSPLGKAIIHKMQLVETGQITKDEWDNYPLKQVAADIQSGKIPFMYKPDRRVKHIWDLD